MYVMQPCILHADADNILFIKYEDMKENHKEAIKSIAKFMGHDLTPDVVDSICEQTTFESMQENIRITALTLLGTTNVKRHCLKATQISCVKVL